MKVMDWFFVGLCVVVILLALRVYQDEGRTTVLESEVYVLKGQIKFQNDALEFDADRIAKTEHKLEFFHDAVIEEYHRHGKPAKFYNVEIYSPGGAK